MQSLSCRAKSRHLWLLSSEGIERFLDSARNDKDSFQFRQLGFDLLKILEPPDVVVALGVSDYSIFLDNERRAFRHAAHSEVHLRQEGVVHYAVLFRDFMFVVAQQRHGDLLLLRPG